jgi:hypothetical protein
MIPRLTALAAFSALMAVAGCASTPTSPLLRPPPDLQGEVVVFRESAFAAGGVALTVGANSKAFVNIGNGDKVRALVPVGEHEFFVRARSAEPTKLKISVERGGTLCLRTSASPSTYAKVAVPITLVLTGYHFYLDQVPCPPPEELGKYKEVPVLYQ